MTVPLLSLAAVDKQFGRVPILQNVDLEIGSGEFVTLIGGSGSGKTTLLRIVGGLDSATAGRVTLRGEVVDDTASRRFVPPERRRLGMVFQDYALWPHMTASETVEAALTGLNRQRRAMLLLEQLGIETLASRRPAQLSGGQQQRVGLARALAAEPDLVLFDEPLSSLDVDVRDRMRVQIRNAMKATGAAALFVSHDPTDAWRLADRIVVLERGRIAQAGTPQQIYAQPATARIARFTDAIGGFPVTVEGVGERRGFAWANGVQEATVADGLSPGQAGVIFVRPCGARAGHDGEPAVLVASMFEEGLWRSAWRLPAFGWTLYSLETAPPPGETRLRLSAEHVFIFAQEEAVQ